MPEDADTPSGHENQSQPSISGAQPRGQGPGRVTDDAPGAEARSFQTRPGDVEPAPDFGGPQAYEPSDVESTRIRMQGGGMGQKDLDRQQDPTRSVEPTQVVASEADMSNDPDPARSEP